MSTADSNRAIGAVEGWVRRGNAPESLGAKLRRLARTADNNNPLSRPPFVLPAAWTASTAYNLGDVVSNGGNWFVNAGAGTSAASGGPTVVADGDAHTDGTALWTFYGSPTAAASDAAAPTVTNSTSNPTATYTNIYKPSATPSVYRAYGGYSTALRTDFWQVQTFNQAAASPTSRGASVGFMTDALELAIFCPATGGAVRLIIDGRYYSVAPFNFGGSDTWVTVKFSTVGGKRARLIQVEGNKSLTYFGYVAVKAVDQVWAPPTADDVRAAFISDSLFAGSNYGPWLPGASVPSRVGKLLGWSDVWNFSSGGTGYVNPGASLYTYGQRIAEALTRTPDIWVFMGSTNDIGQSGVQAAALAAFQAIRAGGSTAPIVVFGVWSLNNAGVTTAESAVSAAETQFSDPLGKTFFVPVYADAFLPWVTGAWNNTALTTSTNATMYIAGDNTHPADIGTAYLAERMARAIRNGVLPSLT